MENFMTKATALKAELDAAKAALYDAQEIFDDAAEAYYKLFEDAAICLSKEFAAVQKTLGEKKIPVKTTAGTTKIIGIDTDIYIDGMGAVFTFSTAHNKIIAIYDTPEQVKTVLEMFKAAVTRGDTEFKFPSVDELKRTE